MNVIFLDIDGVMNHREYFVESKKHFLQEFCPIAVKCLKEIIDKTDAYIVVSSTWRLNRSIEELKMLFSYYDLGERVVGKTPDFMGEEDERRGTEIQAYINRVKGTDKEVDKFIVIDDDDFDMHIVKPRLVHCKDYSGLNWTRMYEALKLMSE